MALEIVRNNITAMHADAVALAGRSLLQVGGNLNKELYQKAGPELLEARKAIGTIRDGDAALAPAVEQQNRYVIYMGCPLWAEGESQEKLLRQTYSRALKLAHEQRCRSIAFSMDSVRDCGVPRDIALSAAVYACNEFLAEHRLRIALVDQPRTDFQLPQMLANQARNFVDEQYIEKKKRKRNPNRREACANIVQSDHEPVTPKREKLPQPNLIIVNDTRYRDLKVQLNEQEETFSDAVRRIIIEKDLKDTEVYGRIYMNRTTFNKIKNQREHQPRRNTALQMAIALRLNFNETQDLIEKAGYKLTRSSRSDLIIQYCLNEAIYDTYTIDSLLVAEDQKTLFSKK